MGRETQRNEGWDLLKASKGSRISFHHNWVTSSRPLTKETMGTTCPDKREHQSPDEWATLMPQNNASSNVPNITCSMMAPSDREREKERFWITLESTLTPSYNYFGSNVNSSSSTINCLSFTPLVSPYSTILPQATLPLPLGTHHSSLDSLFYLILSLNPPPSMKPSPSHSIPTPPSAHVLLRRPGTAREVWAGPQCFVTIFQSCRYGYSDSLKLNFPQGRDFFFYCSLKCLAQSRPSKNIC